MPMLSSQRLSIIHDGLLAGSRGTLASGDLVQHNGLLVAIIVFTTLADLEAATAKGLTGGDSGSCFTPKKV
jgi:Domain of unknown function (DUF222)